MKYFEKLDTRIKTTYSNDYFSGDYNHEIYLMKANDDGSHRPKYSIIPFGVKSKFLLIISSISSSEIVFVPKVSTNTDIGCSIPMAYAT